MANQIRVLYSFPHKLGADRICYTAWQQVNGLAQAGAKVLVYPGAMSREVSPEVSVKPTLAIGRARLPYRILGTLKTLALHDAIVAKRLRSIANEIDIVHTWPLGSLRTLKVARELGIPTVLERPNAHTRFAYEVVAAECKKVGITLPDSHEHAYNKQPLSREEAEYMAAFRLLSPSDFVSKTFIDLGFSPERIMRHQYGYDDVAYFPGQQQCDQGVPLRMLFVGGCAPRKGLHYALEAWLRSEASRSGEFLIAGAFVPGYAERMDEMLSHPSIRILGHRKDVPELMRKSHILVLPSVEEGSALVTSEARGSGCVLLVSEAAGAMCTHMKDALVHSVGDVAAITQHIDLLNSDRHLLASLREASLNTSKQITWKAAGLKLLSVYCDAIAMYRESTELSAKRDVCSSRI